MSVVYSKKKKVVKKSFTIQLLVSAYFHEKQLHHSCPYPKDHVALSALEGGCEVKVSETRAAQPPDGLLAATRQCRHVKACRWAALATATGTRRPAGPSVSLCSGPDASKLPAVRGPLLCECDKGKRRSTPTTYVGYRTVGTPLRRGVT